MLLFSVEFSHHCFKKVAYLIKNECSITLMSEIFASRNLREFRIWASNSRNIPYFDHSRKYIPSRENNKFFLQIR